MIPANYASIFGTECVNIGTYEIEDGDGGSHSVETHLKPSTFDMSFPQGGGDFEYVYYGLDTNDLTCASGTPDLVDYYPYDACTSSQKL